MSQVAPIQVFTVTKANSGKCRVVEDGAYSPISLRIDGAQTNAQVRFALAAFTNHFKKG